MANEVKVERSHLFAVYQQANAGDYVDKLRVERAHLFAVYQQANAGDYVDKLRVERSHLFAVYANEDAGNVDMVRVKRAHLFAVYKAVTSFYISGSSLKVRNAQAGTYNVTVRATDAHGKTKDKTFSVTIN